MSTVLDSIDKKLRRKKVTKKQSVIDGFYSYMYSGSESSLLTPVYALANAAMSRVDEQFTDEGALNLGDDFAQNVVIDIWDLFIGNGVDAERNPKKPFEGDGEDFYALVSRVISNHRHDARECRFRETNVEVTVGYCRCVECRGKENKHFDYREYDDKGNMTKVYASKYSTLSVDKEDEDGEMEVVDNPELVKRPLGYYAQEYAIPDSVQGIDLAICEEIMFNGKTYPQVAEVMGLTEQAVKDRMYKLRIRIADERALERASKEKRRSERDEEYNKQLMIRMRARARVDAYLDLNLGLNSASTVSPSSKSVLLGLRE